MYRLDVRGYEKVQAVVSLLWCFLSGPKRVQASKAMLECKNYVQMRALHGKGRAKFTLEQVRDLRARYALVKENRLRAPRDWATEEAARLNVSKHTLAHILKGRGYV